MTGRILIAMMACLASEGASAGPQEPAPKVETVAVRRGDLKEPFRLAGELASRHREGVYAPELPNVRQLVAAWVAEEGSAVKAGDPLVNFDPRQVRRRIARLDNRLKLAGAALTRLEKQLGLDRQDRKLEVDRAEIALERARLLAIGGVGLMPALQVEKARIDKETAELDLRLAREALAAAEKRNAEVLAVERLKLGWLEKELELTRDLPRQLEMRAPRDGILAKPFVRSTQGLAKLAAGTTARAGDLILELIDPQQPVVLFCWRRVGESRIKKNHPVQVTPWAFPEVALQGKVESLQWNCSRSRPDSEAAGGLLGRIELAGADPRLVPGMSVWLEGELVLSKGALLLPRRAVRQQGARAFVQLQTATGFVDRQVKLGRSTADWLEITDGVKEGDVVAAVQP